MGRTAAVRERLLFLRQFVASPRYLGSITPSSHFLVVRLVSLADIAAMSSIVELGPGTGPFTAGLLRRMGPDARLLCVERDPDLAEHLRARFPDERLHVVTGDAAELARHLADNGFDHQVPLIVSGLPFTSLPEETRERILRAVTSSLTRDGAFLLYQYSHAMRGRLRRYFATVESFWELRNIPPAVCMRCKN